MLALINPEEKIYDKDNNILGSRVCYFYDEQFDVATPLFFVNTEFSFDDKDPQFFFYDDNQHTVKYIPEEHLPKTLTSPEPTSVNALSNEELIQKLLEQKLKEYGVIFNKPTANTN